MVSRQRRRRGVEISVVGEIYKVASLAKGGVEIVFHVADPWAVEASRALERRGVTMRMELRKETGESDR